jgi:hypothetical protein
VPPAVERPIGEQTCTNGAPPATKMLNDALLPAGFMSDTATVNVKVPPAVGVPKICPVEGFSERPGGNPPATTLQLTGSTPPVDARTNA